MPAADGLVKHELKFCDTSAATGVDNVGCSSARVTRVDMTGDVSVTTWHDAVDGVTANIGPADLKLKSSVSEVPDA